MVRFPLRAVLIAAALLPVGCGKVVAPGEGTADAPHGDATPDAAHLSKPVAAITSIGIAGTQAQCTAATEATGPGTIDYVASWTIDGFPFTTTTTTTIAGDTVPGDATHTGGVVECTLFATNGTETTVSDPVTVTFKPRLAYVIEQSGISGTLDTIDLDTLTKTAIGPLNVNFAFGDLAWDATHQVLYMVDGRGAKALYTVDTTTGSATEIGADGLTDVFALGFDGSGNLYGGVQNPPVGGATLQLVNQASGAMTGIGGTVGMSGLAFDSTRSIMMTIMGPNSALTPTGEISSVNLATGAQTVLASPGNVSDVGLTYDPFTDKLWAADLTGTIYRYDPTTSYSRVTMHQFSGSQFAAIAIILPAP